MQLMLPVSLVVKLSIIACELAIQRVGVAVAFRGGVLQYNDSE